MNKDTLTKTLMIMLAIGVTALIGLACGESLRFIECFTASMVILIFIFGKDI